MKFDEDQSSRELTLNVLGVLKEAAEYLLAVDRVDDRMRRMSATTSPLTAAVAEAHQQFSLWLQQEPFELDADGYWLCCAERTVVSDDQLDEHLVYCDGGTQGQHWPVVGRQQKGVVTRANRTETRPNATATT